VVRTVRLALGGWHSLRGRRQEPGCLAPGRAPPSAGTALITQARNAPEETPPRADTHIHPEHDLGLDKAREIALKWAEEVETDFDMACTIIEGDLSDTVEFNRSGVSGQLIVAADQFDMNAKLRFRLGAFAKTIEKEILANLDRQLAAAKPVSKSAPKRKALNRPAHSLRPSITITARSRLRFYSESKTFFCA
jgi:putative polyhydroxyalkanoate system protein